jgi:hypothetical protein
MLLTATHAAVICTCSVVLLPQLLVLAYSQVTSCVLQLHCGTAGTADTSLYAEAAAGDSGCLARLHGFLVQLVGDRLQ